MCPHICVTAYVRRASSEIRYLYDKNGYFATDEYDTVSFYSFVKNAHGEVVRVKQQTTVVAEYDYDAFGDAIKCEENGISNPIRHAGYYYDADTENYYLKNRFFVSLFVKI